MGRKAPWTGEEVAAIKQWQATPFVHPLTCPNHGDQPLTVTSEAVCCPLCDWRQTWVPTAVTVTRPEKPGVTEIVGLFVNVRVEDRAAIKSAAGDLGMTMADYIVERCLGRAALPRGPYAELEQRVAAVEAAFTGSRPWRPRVPNPPEEGC